MKRPNDTDPITYEPGDYGYFRGYPFYRIPAPPEDGVILANLTNHALVIEPDGTWTATPSIKVCEYTGKEWHGYLTKGEWRWC